VVEEISSNIGHKIWAISSFYFGGTHAILHTNSGYEAFGSLRRYGKAFMKIN